MSKLQFTIVLVLCYEIWNLLTKLRTKYSQPYKWGIISFCNF